MNASIFLVSLGGIFGTLLRYTISVLFNNSPFATIIINLTGCFLIGICHTCLTHYFPHTQAYRLLFITGFIGSFTTFSTFSFETIQFLKQDESINAALYLMIQICGGIAMVWLGENVLSK